MSSTKTDRLNGVTDGVAVKAPCRVATTVNITLSGLQTVDGVALAAGDRVLVKNQSTASQNGIYVASTGPWARAADFDGSGDAVRGTRVYVNFGSVGQNTVYTCTASDPISFGTSTIPFARDTLNTGDADAVIYQQSVAATTVSVGDKLRERVSVKDFGATGDGATDDTAAVQAALAYAASVSDKRILYFPAGDYRLTTLTSPLILPSNIIVCGDGMEVTQIRWADTASGRHLFNTPGGESRENIAIQDIHLRGSHDTNVSEVGAYPIVLESTTQNVRIDRVKVTYSRVFGMAVREADSVFVSGCVVEHCAADGISVYGCRRLRITDNSIRNCDDDAISFGTEHSRAASFRTEAVITGNVIANAQGINGTGVNNVVIANNQLRNIKTRGISLLWDDGFGGLGSNTIYGVVIEGNTINNVLNLSSVESAGNSNFYISVQAKQQAGSGSSIPGEPNGSGVFTSLLGALDNMGTSAALGGAHWVKIANNVLIRTMRAGDSFSAYGDGDVYERDGAYDPTLTDAMIDGPGIQTIGVRNSIISGNIIANIAIPIEPFGPSSAYISDGTVISGNLLYNFKSFGVAMSGDGIRTNVRIVNNVFDGDPFCANSGRNSNGTWQTQWALPAIYAQGEKGLDVSFNVFRNVSIPVDSSEPVNLVGNRVDCKPVDVGFSTSNGGVGFVPSASESYYHFVVETDPSNAAFGQLITAPVRESSSIPTSGTYVRGHFVRDVSYPIGAGKIRLGWARLTTGTGHTAGTDWSPVYGTTS
jgi:hypothetical protein